MRQPVSLALFCKVVDNYGDIGICWRLARQFHHEHGIAVTLWVDDLASFRRLCPDVLVATPLQRVQGVTVRHWESQNGIFAATDIADIVIEFFACDIPPGYIDAMAQCATAPLWFNLEGLSAETWVEGCHGLSSPHPRLKLTKYFFFPGFTPKTGGLPREAALIAERQQFQSDPEAMALFLAQYGVTAAEHDGLKVLLFCYPHAPVAELLANWAANAQAVTCMVPEGVATAAVSAFIGQEARPGVSATRGALTLRVLPFVVQADYDRLLWACDINFVRGEDSFVRAQWAGRPFIWHIYPQDEDLHHTKLRAFLQRYAGDLPALGDFSLGWNGVPQQGGVPPWPDLWQALAGSTAPMTRRASDWEREMVALGDFTANLLKFADALRRAD